MKACLLMLHNFNVNLDLLVDPGDDVGAGDDDPGE